MAGRVLDKVITTNKFRGALVGALIGDCLGAPFNHDERVTRVVLQKYFDKMEDPKFKSPAKSYTDDTAMTKSIVESLIKQGSFNEVDIAKRFVANYFSPNEPNRNYGELTSTVFRKLRNNKFEDIWLPAKEQHGGEGSFDSGGAVRVAPISLFFFNDYDLMLNNAEKCTKLTHTHKVGVNGALLQAIAVHQSFLQTSTEPLNVDKFLNDLIGKMEPLEKHEVDSVFVGEEGPAPYISKLTGILNLLKKDEVEDEEVVTQLSSDTSALSSVPTAIYCFLRSQKSIKTVKTDNKFRRAIQFSISLGGNTDTVASMTGAISGAYHGYDYIDKHMQAHCEKLKETVSLADQLHDIVVK